ncbi:MAG: ClpXP protease specificity-enhancing factor [Acidiferrobacterales bacterium]
MTPIKAYLVRAVRDWAVDNGLTPHVVVDIHVSGVNVPTEFAENGRILLNIHPRAVERYELEGESLLFSARFAGSSRAVQIPLAAIRAIYARENGQGVAFSEEPGTSGDNEGSSDPTSDDSPPRKGSHLKIVK